MLGMEWQLCEFSQPDLSYIRHILTFLVKGITFGLGGVGGRESYTCVVLRHCCLVPDVGNEVRIQSAVESEESLFFSQSQCLFELPTSTNKVSPGD